MSTSSQTAKRKLAKLVAALEAGQDVLDAAESANTPERVKEYAVAWLAKRETGGVVMALEERSCLARYAFDAIGRMPLSDVRPLHVRSILDAAAKGLEHKTIANASAL